VKGLSPVSTGDMGCVEEEGRLRGKSVDGVRVDLYSIAVHQSMLTGNTPIESSTRSFRLYNGTGDG